MGKLPVFYRLVETAMGRNRVNRIGRWLYLGARREHEFRPERNGEYALQEWLVNSLEQIERQHVVLFDVGANRGDWTCSAMMTLRNKQFENWRIHAFEPAPAIFSRLAARFSIEIEKALICVHNAALSSTDEDSTFYVTGDSTGTSSLVKNMEMTHAPTITVKTTRLDNFMVQHSIENIAMLKIDTEGNDYQVLKGARAALESQKIKIIQFEYNWRWLFQNNNLKDVFQLFEGLPYEIGRLTSDMIEIYTQWHPELDRFFECNYVIVSKGLLPRLPHKFMEFNRQNVAIESLT